MNKQLPTTGIANELAESSVFFQPPTPAELLPGASEKANQPNSTPQTAEVTQPADVPTNQTGNRDSTLPRNHAIAHATKQERKQPPMQDDLIDDHLDEIRKAVKQLGKELSTHRFTTEEKTVLSDIVYTYSRQGVRTSENEITRIGVNWLLVDYQQNGANSVLARMLERLHR
ncbi:MAG: hypothetical protein IT329_15975 [Caldilineaceae bacterium]|nr:hypothetical protein [Caldilineaceae bacterium]